MHEKADCLADFKNVNKANYKDTRITTEVVLMPFLLLLEYVLIYWDILRNNKLDEF